MRLPLIGQALAFRGDRESCILTNRYCCIFGLLRDNDFCCRQRIHCAQRHHQRLFGLILCRLFQLNLQCVIISRLLFFRYSLKKLNVCKGIIDVAIEKNGAVIKRDRIIESRNFVGIQLFQVFRRHEGFHNAISGIEGDAITNCRFRIHHQDYAVLRDLEKQLLGIQIGIDVRSVNDDLRIGIALSNRCGFRLDGNHIFVNQTVVFFVAQNHLDFRDFFIQRITDYVCLVIRAETHEIISEHL